MSARERVGGTVTVGAELLALLLETQRAAVKLLKLTEEDRSVTDSELEAVGDDLRDSCLAFEDFLADPSGGEGDE